MLLHVTTYLQGGAGRAVADLALAARRAGRDVAVVATRTPVPGYENYSAYLQALEDARVRTLLVDSTFDRSLEANLTAAAAIRAALPIETLTLVHAHAGTPARIGLLLARAAREEGLAVPVIQTMHGWGTSKSEVHERQDLETLAAVHAIVVTSEASADEMVRRGVDRALITTIPCGLEARARFVLPRHAVAEEAAARRAAGAAVILSVGTVNRNKNQVALVRALPAMLPRRSVLCVLVGEGPGIAEVERESRALGVEHSVRFVGYQADAAAWLSVADLLVQPSLSEGQGLAVLEAFRAGVPVAASDIPAHRELIAEGPRGWLFDPSRPEDLARALDEALGADEAQRARVTASASALFEARYTIEAMVAGYEGLYAALLAVRR